MDPDVDLTNQLRRQEGYLYKRGSDTKFVGEPKWQKRYFVLQGETLSYKKKKEDKEFSHVIHMSDVKFVDMSDISAKKKEISLPTSERTYMLRCTEEGESDDIMLDRWYSDIATNHKILEKRGQPKEKGLSSSSSSIAAISQRISNVVASKTKEKEEEKSSVPTPRERDKGIKKPKSKDESPSAPPQETNLPLPSFIKDSIKHIRVTPIGNRGFEETQPQSKKSTIKSAGRFCHWEKYHPKSDSVKTVELPADLNQSIRVGWARRLLNTNDARSTQWREVCLVPVGGGTIYFCHSLQKAQVVDFVSVGCIADIRIISSLKDAEFPICGQNCPEADDLLPTMQRDIQTGPASDSPLFGGALCEMVVTSMPQCEQLSSIILLFRELQAADEWVEVVQRMRTNLPDFCRVYQNPFKNMHSSFPAMDSKHLRMSSDKLSMKQNANEFGASIFVHSVVILLSAILCTFFFTHTSS